MKISKKYLKNIIFRKVIPGSTSRLIIVDHNESYGRHVLEKAAKGKEIRRCLDIGCGSGADLATISKLYPQAELLGIDFGEWNHEKLRSLNIKPFSVNVEAESLPFEDNSLDFIIANQFLEHTKEIFWINHEIFRSLKVGGYLFIGVPNLLSLHNRVLMTLGHHPTQHKLTSAHVRPFSKKDTCKFYRDIGSKFCRIAGFWGSQFYPFPKLIARPLSRIFPSLSFSIFFLIQKTGEYDDSFIGWPERAELETNYFVGPHKEGPHPII
jgi:ubiquinone/menaquinone biosynthesis C-methylase UbiE